MQNSPCADADNAKRAERMRTREEFAINYRGPRSKMEKHKRLLEAFDIHI